MLIMHFFFRHRIKMLVAMVTEIHTFIWRLALLPAHTQSKDKDEGS